MAMTHVQTHSQNSSRTNLDAPKVIESQKTPGAVVYRGPDARWLAGNREP
jgi:hypothetical protein